VIGDFGLPTLFKIYPALSARLSCRCKAIVTRLLGRLAQYAAQRHWG